MDSLAPKSTLASGAKSGMYTLTAASAQRQLTGTEKCAKHCRLALEAKYSTAITNAGAPKAIFGAKICAFTLRAMAGKSGQDQSVCAQPGLITTGRCALSA